MKKAIIIGCPGSVKTTFSEKLHTKTDLPLFHLDAIWHKADRTHITREEFDIQLAKILSLDRWIIDGNYSRTLGCRIAACDTIFLFNLPTDVCLEGAVSRLGKKRPDMPWIDTELDQNLKTEIEEFSSKNSPVIYELLQKHQANKTIIIFKSRDEADKFIEKLKACEK